MASNELILVIPTHSNYMDVCDIFLELLEKNWSDIKFKIVISLTGNNIKYKNYEVLYNGETASLPTCIYNVAKKYDSDYYLCMLGDAFINKKICNFDVTELLSALKENKINYCSLLPRKSIKKQKKVNNWFRYIYSKDRYNHTFVSFFASKTFIYNEFSNGCSDLDFENKYLQIAEDNSKSFYYNDRVVLTKNNFNIIPGINKGKWDRYAYKILKRNNENIVLCDRPLQSKSNYIVDHYLTKVYHFVPSRIIKNIKNHFFNK